MELRTYVQVVTSLSYSTYLTHRGHGGAVVKTYSGWWFINTQQDELSTYSDCHLLGVF